MADDVLTRFKLSDQTSLGLDASSWLPSIASDSAALKMNGPLLAWYMQALPMVTDPNTKKIYDTVNTVVNRNRFTRQRMKSLSSDIVKRIEALDAAAKSEPPATTATEKTKLADTVSKMLAMAPDKPADTTPVTARFQATGGGNRLQEIVKKWAGINASTGDKTVEANKIISQYENDPIASPEHEKITVTDRIIFIAMTFIVRSVCLHLVEWAASTYMVKSFQSAFGLYLMCYLALFVIWAILVNASNSLFFRMLFYYINTESNGYGRIIVHLLVLLILVPIPLIVHERGFQTTQEEYTFEKRRKTVTILSNFTFVLWLITSIIALRY